MIKGYGTDLVLTDVPKDTRTLVSFNDAPKLTRRPEGPEALIMLKQVKVNIDLLF